MHYCLDRGGYNTQNIQNIQRDRQRVYLMPSPLKPIRILLVDDHLLMLWALERLIECEKIRMEIVGKATSCAEALKLAVETHPDVILLNIDLDGENTLNILPQLVSNSQPKARVLLLTGLRDTSIHDNAVLAGAFGVIGREGAPEEILRAIAKVHQGELWLDPAAIGRIFVELSRKRASETVNPERQKISSLTTRERQIISAIMNQAGAINRVIAEMLHITEHTLHNHLTSIYEKLGVANRLELYVYANKHDLRQITEAKI